MKTSLKVMRAAICALALIAGFPVDAAAQRVVILIAEDPGSVADLVNDVRTRVLATGQVAEIDVLDVSTSTPALAALDGYDSVLLWPNLSFSDPDALGDMLADYVDAGHGVVQAMFSFDADMPGARLGGRWLAEGYDVFGVAPTNMGDVSLVAAIPDHALLAGVGSVVMASGFFADGTVPAACAEVVAHWSTGQPLVGWCPGRRGGRVVGLNMYAPSNAVFPFAWRAETDGARLMANALRFAGTAPPPTSHAPVANAGPDVVVEANAPGFVEVTLVGTGTDDDGDTLMFAWSGAGTGNAASLTTMLPVPAAPHKEASYTFTLTVDDGNGGTSSDDVVVTVRDTTGPVLSGVTDVVTAPATSDSGAVVNYGPVTASDAVDGDVAVSCSPTGSFPIGDTPVSCSAVDSRGNASSVTFIVRVTDVHTPGTMWGAGYVKQNNLRYEFDFIVRENARGSERAWFDLKVTGNGHSRLRRSDRFEARSADFVAFSDDPTVRHGKSARPHVDTVLFSGSGEWNGRRGYRYEVHAVDSGVGQHHESIRVTIKGSDGRVVASFDGRVLFGCVRSARIRH